jgi:dolichol-phosphate mannosyltransferase
MSAQQEPSKSLSQSQLANPREMPRLLSIVIPLYNEEAVLPLLRERLTIVSRQWNCPVEYILVDDGSSDTTLKMAIDWATDISRVKVVALSRNFGHQPAVLAGLRHATGDAVVVMDADLQDPPELVSEMLTVYCEGYDVVYAQRKLRHGETAFKQWTAKLFYRIMRRGVMGNLPEDTGDFRLIGRRALDVICSLPEHSPFLRGLSAWVGFSQKAILYDRAARAAGTTKYTVRKLISMALHGIVAFTDFPLYATLIAGFTAIAASVVLMIWTILQNYLSTIPTAPGWASLIVSQSFFAGVILIALGMHGIYIARIHAEVLRRPVYVVARVFSLKEPEAHDEASDE